MVRAWYGVSSTGNQAGVTLERLAHLQEGVFPAAVVPLTRDKYVDDIALGADTKSERDIQIRVWASAGEHRQTLWVWHTSP
jgi:hypothetical protein